MVKCKCDWCGKEITQPPSQYKKSSTHFCNRSCRTSFRNTNDNPVWKQSTREKIRISRLGTGSGESYPKYYGRHEHRVVAEDKLGRPLAPGEIVHHIDGDKRNNTPANIVVLHSQSAHIALHRDALISAKAKRGGDAQ